MLTGRRAFLEGTGPEILVSILRDDRRVPRTWAWTCRSRLTPFCFDASARISRSAPVRGDLSFALRMVAARGEGSRPEDPAPPALPRRCMPFSNLSPDPESEYFSTPRRHHGGADPPPLARVRGYAWRPGLLRSHSRTGMRTPARSESVSASPALLEGSVRKAGDRCALNAQLINVADGYHLWSDHLRSPHVGCLRHPGGDRASHRFPVQGAVRLWTSPSRGDTPPIRRPTTCM